MRELQKSEHCVFFQIPPYSMIQRWWMFHLYNDLLEDQLIALYHVKEMFVVGTLCHNGYFGTSATWWEKRLSADSWNQRARHDCDSKGRRDPSKNMDRRVQIMTQPPSSYHIDSGSFDWTWHRWTHPTTLACGFSSSATSTAASISSCHSQI